MTVNYVVRFSDGTYAGSPLTLRTANRSLAGTLGSLDEARRAARTLGGYVWTCHRWVDRHLDGPVEGGAS